MKVRVWRIDTESAEGKSDLVAEFSLDEEGIVVVKGEPGFLKNWKEDPVIYAPDDIDRVNPVTPDDGEDYLVMLQDHFRGWSMTAEIVEEDDAETEAR